LLFRQIGRVIGITESNKRRITMASPSVLKQIVRNGGNLILCRGITPDLLRELASMAKTSGAHLTVTTDVNPGVINELCTTYGNAITFIDGLGAFEKSD
jgi:hypothetical protein